MNLWNSIAVLVTTRDRVEEIVELYERKRSYKELEAKLGLV